MIEYRGYIGHFAFDETENIFYGKVANTYSLITFQGKSVKNTQLAFRDSIDDYINWCKRVKRDPRKIRGPIRKTLTILSPCTIISTI